MATNFFVTVTPKIFDGKTWYPPFSSTNPFGNRNFIKNSWISRRTFSAAWGIKISTENRDLPPLVHNFFFDTMNLLEKRRVSVQKFSFRSCQTKNFDKTVMSPSYACKFSIKEFFLNTKVVSNEIFWYSHTKTFRRKIVIPPPIHKIFFWNTEWFPGEVFSVLWDEKHFEKTVKLSPSFALKFSIPEIFRNTEGFFYDFYRHCETKNFQRSSVISPSYA